MWLVAVVNRSTVSALGKDLNTPKQQAKATMEELQRLREIDEDNGDSEQVRVRVCLDGQIILITLTNSHCVLPRIENAICE